MKANELRDMSAAELTKKLAELKEELFNLRFQHAINQLENPGRIETVKKDIARVKTVMRSNELKDAQEEREERHGTQFEKNPRGCRCVRQDG